MTLKLNYLKKPISNTKSIWSFFLMIGQNYSLRKNISYEEFNYIKELLKTSDPKKILTFEINSKKIILLIVLKII